MTGAALEQGCAQHINSKAIAWHARTLRQGRGGAPATARSTWRRLHGSLRPLTCSAASCFFLSRAGGAGPANCADACVGRTPHQGESVSIKRRRSGMAATAVRLSSVFSEQPFTPAGRGAGR